jgi:DNA-binding MarR family transcriptional regulator
METVQPRCEEIQLDTRETSEPAIKLRLNGHVGLVAMAAVLKTGGDTTIKAVATDLHNSLGVPRHRARNALTHTLAESGKLTRSGQSISPTAAGIEFVALHAHQLQASETRILAMSPFTPSQYAILGILENPIALQPSGWLEPDDNTKPIALHLSQRTDIDETTVNKNLYLAEEDGLIELKKSSYEENHIQININVRLLNKGKKLMKREHRQREQEFLDRLDRLPKDELKLIIVSMAREINNLRAELGFREVDVTALRSRAEDPKLVDRLAEHMTSLIHMVDSRNAAKRARRVRRQASLKAG